MIDGVRVSPRQVIADPRGDVLHMLKRTDEAFTEFGEVYFSKVNVGQSKTWRRHLRATSQLAVPVGHVHFVLFDDRTQSPTCGEHDSFFIGETNHHLLTIPPLVWYAFENTGAVTALIGNCASLPHDPSESEKRKFSDDRMPSLRGN
jgi:dTDP-4-dehydrorhamnose 3,5-epimerase